MKTFVAQAVKHWRQWLDEHHDSETQVWLVFHKLHTSVASIAYADARDEALCFGWVDSLVKRLDDSRYAIKFTPRRADSRWSAINRKRYAALKASGRLKPGGIERAPTNHSYGPRPRYELPAAIPRYIQAALRKHPAACAISRGLRPRTAGDTSAGSSLPSARNKGQASRGGDSYPHCWQTAGAQINGRPASACSRLRRLPQMRCCG